jgi:hypothetical protein
MFDSISRKHFVSVYYCVYLVGRDANALEHKDYKAQLVFEHPHS